MRDPVGLLERRRRIAVLSRPAGRSWRVAQSSSPLGHCDVSSWVGWVDRASFAVMAELGLQGVFGFDADFARAGFRAYRASSRTL
jgi:hypothetical protein